MPTLPLFETPAHPDAWHRVIAPGGYEWWLFSAKNADDLSVFIAFWDGDIENKQYRRAFDRYVARPTRTLPPSPRDYPMVSMRVWTPGTPGPVEEVAYPPGSFQGSVERPGITVGPNQAEWIDGGQVIRVTCDLRSFGADLTFRATEPAQFEWKLDEVANSKSPIHTLRGIPSSYEVTGTIRTRDNSSMAFNGVGVRGHFFGTSLR